MTIDLVMLDLADAVDQFGPAPKAVVRGAGRGWMRLGSDELHWAFERAARQTEIRDECWWWTGYARNGYGTISIRNSPVYLHHLSHAAVRGDLPADNEVCHTCDNRPCWNPNHLFGGTRTDNVRDMWNKGRASKPPRVAGQLQHLATLTDDEVTHIRAMSGVRQRDIAAAFGCSQSTVWRLIHGKVR